MAGKAKQASNRQATKHRSQISQLSVPGKSFCAQNFCVEISYHLRSKFISLTRDRSVLGQSTQPKLITTLLLGKALAKSI